MTTTNQSVKMTKNFTKTENFVNNVNFKNDKFSKNFHQKILNQI